MPSAMKSRDGGFRSYTARMVHRPIQVKKISQRNAQRKRFAHSAYAGLDFFGGLSQMRPPCRRHSAFSSHSTRLSAEGTFPFPQAQPQSRPFPPHSRSRPTSVEGAGNSGKLRTRNRGRSLFFQSAFVYRNGEGEEVKHRSPDIIQTGGHARPCRQTCCIHMLSYVTEKPRRTAKERLADDRFIRMVQTL